MIKTSNDLSPHITDENRSLFLTILSFPIEFSLDWFPTVSSRDMTDLILSMHNHKWIMQKQDQKGMFVWTSTCPRQRFLNGLSKEERAKYYRNAIDILKQNQPHNEKTILEIAHQCVRAGVREDDLDIILQAACLEEKKHRNISAIRFYEIVLEFIEELNNQNEANLSDWHRRSYIQAAENRTALAHFYPNRDKLWKWLSLAEKFASQVDDQRVHASLDLLIGQNYCVTFQMKKAIAYFKRAEEIISILNDEDLYKKSLKAQILFHINENDLYGAIKAYEKSIGSIDSFEDIPFSLYSTFGMAFAFTEGGMPKRALGICTAIRSQFKATENKAIVAATFVMEGIILFQIKELLSSRKCFEQGLEYLKGEGHHLYESVARIGLICIDFLEENVNAASFEILNKIPKRTWHDLLIFFYIFESIFTLYQKNIKIFKNKDLFSFLGEIKKEHLFPRTYQMIRRLQIIGPDNPMSAEEKIESLLDLEKTVIQECETFEHASIRIELARLYLQLNNREQAEAYARKAWKFLNPIATKAFPSDLVSLLTDTDRGPESSLINLVIEMGNELTKKDTIEQLLTNIIISISRVTGAERAALFIWNHESSFLEMAASRNLAHEDIQNENFKPSLEAIRHALHLDHSRILELEIPEAESMEERKAIIIPLILDGKGMGAIYQDSRFFHINTGPANSEILTALASQIALSIDRARAHEEIAALNTKLIQENLYYQDEIEELRPFGEIIGSSKVMLTLQRLILKVAPTQSTVLIWGETGVGKELVSRAIHRESPRKDKPFIRVNCAALPESLIESELFGHERGAFTGALKSKAGRFELAHQGTIFLDEISELPLPVQSKLLRVLQEKEFQRVGGTKPLYSDFRLITATNKDLKEEVKKGRFREDLYYRLNVYPIFVPSLRERSEDIPLLAMHFLKLFSAMYNKNYSGIAALEMEKLKAYTWPGNIRELSNVIERAVIAGGKKLKFFEHKISDDVILAPDRIINLKEQEKRLTTNLILNALKKSGGKISGKNGAAELLGMKGSAFTLRMKRLGIKIERQPSAKLSI